VGGGPEAARGLDGLFDRHGDVVKQRVEVERLADRSEGGFADAANTICVPSQGSSRSPPRVRGCLGIRIDSPAGTEVPVVGVRRTGQHPPSGHRIVLSHGNQQTTRGRLDPDRGELVQGVAA
jgi:hypothetical protein